MEESISKNEKIREKFELLSVDCPVELVAQWAAKEQASERDYEKVASLLDGIKMLRDRNNCKMLRNMSGLPKVSRRTFDNFDVSRLSSANKDMFEHLKSLSFLDTGFNVVIIGDPGTGKTHIAQAIGNLCCDKLYSTRYYKMAELEKKLKKAIENDKASSLLENLSKVSCLIGLYFLSLMSSLVAGHSFAIYSCSSSTSIPSTPPAPLFEQTFATASDMFSRLSISSNISDIPSPSFSAFLQSP